MTEKVEGNREGALSDAGYDTSATALSFTLFELAKRSDCQEKIKDEIQKFQASTKGNPGQEDLSKFPYTQACLLVGSHSTAFLHCSHS